MCILVERHRRWRRMEYGEIEFPNEESNTFHYTRRPRRWHLLPLRMDIQISSTPSEAELVGRLRRGHSHLQGLGNRWAGEGRKRDRGD